MADYRDLLRRAVEALPENNGAARRQVYDKARKALVAQLDAINPPLPAREKTQHRLQLEDCIREVEQEATERLLGGLTKYEETMFGAGQTPAPSAPQPMPEAEEPAAPEPEEPVEEKEVSTSESEAEPAVDDSEDRDFVEPEASEPVEAEPEAAEPVVQGDASSDTESEDDLPAVSATVADVAAELEKESQPEAEPEVTEPAPAPVDEAEPEPSSEPVVEPSEPVAADDSAVESPTETEPKPTSVESILRDAQISSSAPEVSIRADHEPDSGSVAEDAVPTFTPDVPSALSAKGEEPPAMSSVLEVDPEPVIGETEADDDSSGDPQTKIDHAIAMLDREANGKDENSGDGSADAMAADAADGPAETSDDERGGNALTIFLVVLVVLLGLAGGAGYWAWKEGYVDLQTMFGQGAPQSADVTTPADTTNTADAGNTDGPGNTAATPDATQSNGESLGVSQDTPTDTPVRTVGGDTNTAAADTPQDTSTPVAAPNGDDQKIEDRLPTADTATETTTTEPALGDTTADATAVTGEAQSLLLEASDEGTTGAVPFSGTIEWSRGTDELGQPTLVGEANIPARNFGVRVLLRKNGDPSLPASHLMEIDFSVTESFIGGGVSALPGVLLKDQELVQGSPLAGASARVVGNSFLFALSAADADVTRNVGLLRDRKWMDLAMIYSTGKRAIITLEKDAEAQALFEDVFDQWAAE
jgi:hypothetical protein